MQVDLQDLGKLKRKLSVEVPLSEVESTYNEVSARIRSNVRVNGFRPGKFPRHLAEKRFRAQMESEALNNLLPKYFEQAIREKEIRPATEPRFDELHIEKTQPFRFTAEFEVIPAFESLPASAFKLEENKAEVAAADVDKSIEDMRMERSQLEDKGEEPAGEGDVVTFDFQGELDGEAFAGGSGTDQRIVVGSGDFLPDFAAAFLAIKAGEEKVFPVTFPENYGDGDLGGKTAEFKVQAKKVEKRVPPPLDADFMKQIGEFADEAAFRAHIEQQLLEQRERGIQNECRTTLAEQIKEKTTFDVPEQLVEAHLHEFEHRLTHEEPEALKDEKKLAELKEEEKKRIAETLRFTYFVEEMARQWNIQADQEEVRQRFFMQAYMMRQNPAEFIKTPQGENLVYQIQQQAIANKTLDRLSDEVLGRKPPEDPAAEAAEDAPEGA